MGIESYLLRLRAPERDPGRVVAFLTRSFFAVPDPEQFSLGPAYSHYVYRDGSHVIESELFHDGDATEISLRFALCNPPSIDRVFVGQATDLMTAFGAVATVCEELPKGAPERYAVDELPRFTANCLWSIDRSREQWTRSFGPERLPLSITSAVRRFFDPEAVGAATPAATPDRGGG